MAEGRARGFSVATKCATVDELIEKFRDRIDEESILVNPVEHREVGTECAFAILLADKKPALAGTCVVLDVFTDANNPFKRPGMRLGIKRLGPESQRVFAELLARRIAPRKMTQALPVIAVPPQEVARIRPVIVMPRTRSKQVVPPRTKPNAEIVARTTTTPLGSRSGVPELMRPTATQPMRGFRADSAEVAREAPRRLPTVQIPPTGTDEPLSRAPRATPFDLDNVAKLHGVALGGEREHVVTVDASPVEAKLVTFETKPIAVEAKPAPIAIVHAEPESAPLEAPVVDVVESKPARPRVETRTPGSPFVLPANPLTNMTDESLEGFVDCRLFERHAAGAPDAFPAGTVDREAPAAITEPLIAPVRPRSRNSEPLPLPPPPVPALSPAPAPVFARTQPLPYAATRLPDLAASEADDDNFHYPVVPRRLRNRLLVACMVLPLIGAAAVVAYMGFAAPSAGAVPLAPASVVEPELTEQLRVAVEPAPEAPLEPVPTAPHRMHAVLVKTYPIAARVTVGGRYFGTTPTYIKIPANTKVEVKMVRPGFKPVSYPFTSKRPTDRVFVRLQRGRR